MALTGQRSERGGETALACRLSKFVAVAHAKHALELALDVVLHRMPAGASPIPAQKVQPECRSQLDENICYALKFPRQHYCRVLNEQLSTIVNAEVR